MKDGGRIPICGQISVYNNDDGEKLSKEIEDIIHQKKLDRSRFIVFDYKDQFDHAWNELLKWVKESDLKCRETHYCGIESAPQAFLGLFSGENVGKAVVDASLP